VQRKVDVNLDGATILDAWVVLYGSNCHAVNEVLGSVHPSPVQAAKKLMLIIKLPVGALIAVS
jgi:hypothetical protein